MIPVSVVCCICFDCETCKTLRPSLIPSTSADTWRHEGQITQPRRHLSLIMWCRVTTFKTNTGWCHDMSPGQGLWRPLDGTQAISARWPIRGQHCPPWCHSTCGQCLDIGGESANTEIKYWQATMEIRLTAQNPVPKVLLNRYLNIPIIIILYIIPQVQAFQFLVLALAFLAPTIMESRH